MTFVSFVTLVPKCLLVHLLITLHAMSSSSGDYGGPGVFRPPVPDEASGHPPCDSDDSSSSDGSIRMAAPGPGQRRRLRVRRPRELQTEGVVWCFLVVETASVDGAMHHLLGFAQLQWELRRPEGAFDSNDCGRCVYVVRKVFLIEAGDTLPPDFDVADDFAAATIVNLFGQRALPGGETLATHIRAEGVTFKDVLKCTLDEVDTFRNVARDGIPAELRSTNVRKFRQPQNILFGSPSTGILRAWRKSLKQMDEAEPMEVDDGQGVQASAQSSQGPLLYVPPGFIAESDTPSLPPKNRFLPRERDPIRTLQALAVCQHLRAPKYFTEALDDAYEYLLDDIEEDLPEQRPGRSGDPGQETFRTALARLDCLGCLLNRRVLHQMRQDGTVRSINVYSHASPVVGVELQGMVVDVNSTDGTRLRIILPGSTLAYGHTDTVAKGVALIWGIFLIAGPLEMDVRWFCSLVTSMTTDFGVEMKLLEIPDMVTAFMRWANGTPLIRVRHLVNQERRAFPHALRVAGWSHVLGGIMKHVATGWEDWPVRLAQMRQLCKFLRNRSYIEHLLKMLPHLDRAQKRSLRHFNAGFAKWRYETVAEVLRQLSLVSFLSTDMRLEFFASAQDMDLIHAVVAACRDLGFWRWARAAYGELFKPLESLRRWGMICECPAHVALRATKPPGFHLDCDRSFQRSLLVAIF